MNQQTKTFPALRRDLDDALTAMADHLEQRATAALRTMARKYPKREVAFCSAMGIWTYYVDNCPMYPDDSPMPLTGAAKTIHYLFEDVQQQYGWGAIPAPIKLTIVGGVLERLTDW